MSATVYNITNIEAGADFTFGAQLLDGENPFDLTDCEVYAQIRKDWNYDILVSFVVHIPTPSNGQISFFLPGASTQSLMPYPEATPAKYDVLIVKPTGERIRVLKGTVSISAAISHV